MNGAFIISGISEHLDRLTSTCAYSAVLTDENGESICIELTKSSTGNILAYFKESNCLLPLCDNKGQYLFSSENGDTVYLDIAIAQDN